jgi:hypothetical protein
MEAAYLVDHPLPRHAPLLSSEYRQLLSGSHSSSRDAFIETVDLHVRIAASSHIRAIKVHVMG